MWCRVFLNVLSFVSQPINKIHFYLLVRNKGKNIQKDSAPHNVYSSVFFSKFGNAVSVGLVTVTRISLINHCKFIVSTINVHFH